MFVSNFIKRLLVAGLAIGAASLPATAQARVDEAPPTAGFSSPAQVVDPSAQQQLNQLQSNVQKRFAAEGGWSSITSPVRSPATSQGGFQWGDAGIGAAGMIVLLGTGAGAAGAMRRRRAQRPVIG